MPEIITVLTLGAIRGSTSSETIGGMSEVTPGLRFQYFFRKIALVVKNWIRM